MCRIIRKKINQKGQYQNYNGYTIIAMIDTELKNVAQHIEKFIWRSSYNISYSAVPAYSYHMSIYTIFSLSNKLIPPVQRWVNTGSKLPDRGFLPHNVLKEEHNKALCIIKKYLSEPLRIKYAKLDIGERTIGLILELEEESLKRIRDARKKFAKVYEHKNKSMEPIHKKLHITLAYIYSGRKTGSLKEYNQLKELVRPFNGAKFMPPHVYLYNHMKKYHPYRSRGNVDCRAYEL